MHSGGNYIHCAGWEYLYTVRNTIAIYSSEEELVLPKNSFILHIKLLATVSDYWRNTDMAAVIATSYKQYMNPLCCRQWLCAIIMTKCVMVLHSHRLVPVSRGPKVEPLESHLPRVQRTLSLPANKKNQRTSQTTRD